MQGSITKNVGKKGVTWTARVDLPPEAVTGKRRQAQDTQDQAGSAGLAYTDHPRAADRRLH
jgi:hypothetical protein